MASIYDLKPAFQRLLRPIANALVRIGVTPNAVTLAALLLSAGVGGLLWVRAPDARTLWVLPVFLFVRMALNAIDGMMAKEHDLKSAAGALLNEVGDVISDACLYLPLAAYPGFAPAAMVAVVVLAGLTEMTGVVGVQIGASRRYDGPMGKSDRAFVFGALALALALGLEAGRWLEVVLLVVIALLALTVWNRARRAVAEARRSPERSP